MLQGHMVRERLGNPALDKLSDISRGVVLKKEVWERRSPRGCGNAVPTLNKKEDCTK